MKGKPLTTVSGILNRMDCDAKEIADYAPILEVSAGLSIEHMELLENTMTYMRTLIAYLQDVWKRDGTLS